MKTENSNSDDGSDAEEDISENEISPQEAGGSVSLMKLSPKEATALAMKHKMFQAKLRAMKRKQSNDVDENKKRPSSAKRVRHEQQKFAVAHSSSVGVNEKETKTTKKNDDSKKENDSKKDSTSQSDVIWNDRNCDHDLDDQAATNVHFRKIKIAQNLMLSCKMISALENKNLHSDYAALVFSRKTNKEKCFDFMVDMRVAERLIKALQIIVDENPVFFNKRVSQHSKA